MKKLFLMFAAVAAMTFVSCTQEGNTNAEEAVQEEGFNVEQFTEGLTSATDSTAVIDLLTNAQAEVNKLVEAGDTEGAKTLWDKINEIISQNSEKIAAVYPAITAKVEELKAAAPEGLKDVINAATENLTDKAGEAVEGAKNAVEEKAGEVVDAAKDKAADAVNAAQDKANEAVDAAKDKANEAAAAAAKKIGL